MKRILFYILLFVCTIVSAQTPIYDDLTVWGELVAKKAIVAEDSVETPLVNTDEIRFSDGSIQVTAGGFEDTLKVDIISAKDSTSILFIDPIEADTGRFDNIESNSQTMGATTVTGFGSSQFIMDNTLINKLNFIATSQAYLEGLLFYDSTERALAFFNEFANFKEELNRGVNVVFFNNTGGTIANGKVIRSVGAKVNGSINFLADFAGNGSLDSLQGIALTTIETLDGNYGIASLVGPVNMNTSMWSTNDLLFVGHEGELTNINPTAPEYSDIVGRVRYADADSGSVYFFPVGEARFRPSPTFSASFSGATETIENPGQNIYAPITNATNDLYTEIRNVGFVFQGDSIMALQDGNYTIFYSYAQLGEASQTDIYRTGTFIDGILEYYMPRSISGTNIGGVPYPTTRFISAGSWISFRTNNTSTAIRDCIFENGTVTINFSQ